MGREFVTIAEAAAHLDVSEKAVTQYIQHGYLKHPPNKSVLLFEDVDRLKNDRNACPPFDGVGVTRLYRRVQQLEMRLGAVMRIMNLRSDPLRLSDAELRSLYVMAEQHAKTDVPKGAEEIWCDVLLRLRLEDLEQIAKQGQTENPWAPFYRLAVLLASNPRDRKLRLVFVSARENIQTLANLWIGLHGRPASYSDVASSSDVSPLSKLERLKKKS